MRTGIELPLVPIDVEQLDAQLGAVTRHLIDAIKALPTPDTIPLTDRTEVRDLTWNLAESTRLIRLYRRRLADRLAGATPGASSHHASSHDPPSNACQSRSSPP